MLTCPYSPYYKGSIQISGLLYVLCSLYTHTCVCWAIFFFNLRRLKQTLVGGGVGMGEVVLAVLLLSASVQNLLWRYHLMTSSMISQTRACTESPATVERCLFLRSLGSLIQPLQRAQHFMNVNSIFPLSPRFEFLFNVFLYDNKVCNSFSGLL